MALLRGKRYDDSTFGVSIKPVMPALDGPHHAYEVALYKDDGVLFERQYNVWQYARRLNLGHYWMYRIAETFKRTSALIDVPTEFDASNDMDTVPGRLLRCLTADIDWLMVVLCSKTVKGEQRIIVTTLLDTDEEPSDSERAFKLPHLVALTFYCSPAEAKRFGDELGQECDMAKQRRKELGVSAWDDIDTDEEL